MNNPQEHLLFPRQQLSSTEFYLPYNPIKMRTGLANTQSRFSWFVIHLVAKYNWINRVLNIYLHQLLAHYHDYCKVCILILFSFMNHGNRSLAINIHLGSEFYSNQNQRLQYTTNTHNSTSNNFASLEWIIWHYNVTNNICDFVSVHSYAWRHMYVRQHIELSLV